MLGGVLFAGVVLLLGPFPSGPASETEDATGPVADAPPASETLSEGSDTRPMRRPTGERAGPDAGLAERPPRDGTERAHVRRLLSLARADPRDFEAHVARILAGDGPRNEKVAALRVSYEGFRVPHLEPFSRMLEERDGDAELRDFALRFLGRKARADPQARRFLAGWLETHRGDPRERVTAVYPVLLWADQAELLRGRTYLYGERDLGVVARGAEALLQNPTSSARQLLEDLRHTHPVAAVRRRLAQLLSGSR